MKKIFKEQENKIDFFVFVVVMVIACSPLITKYCINGHDLEYHLLRIESLKEGILMGKPFLRINTLFMGNAGYASSLFYPDFILYIPAFLRVLGVGINASFHILVGVSICLTYLSVRYCVKKMTGSVYPAVMAGLLVVLSPYYLGDIYIRSAVGEYIAFMFIPFVIYGIYNTLYEDMSKPWILGIGFGGVLLTHTNTFIFCIAFGAVAFLVKWKVFKSNIKILGRLLITIVLTMAITAFYWIPVLEMLISMPLGVSSAWISLEETALQFSKIFSNDFPSLGFWLVILAFPRVLIKKNSQNKNLINYADWLLVGGALFAVLTTDIIPWKRLNGLLSFVQFPWRLFCLATVMIAIADAIILYCFIKSSLEPLMQSSMRVLTVLLLIISAAISFRFISAADITYYDYSEDYYSHKPFTANIIAGEWMPLAVSDRDKMVSDSDHMYNDCGEDIDFARVKNTVEADITEAYEYVDVPFVYYKGYSATVKDSAGSTQKLSVDGTGTNGMARVRLDGAMGQLKVKYSGTTLQWISTIVSILSVLGLACERIIRQKNAKKSNSND